MNIYCFCSVSRINNCCCLYIIYFWFNKFKRRENWNLTRKIFEELALEYNYSEAAESIADAYAGYYMFNNPKIVHKENIVKTNYWNNGTAGVNLYFSGTKTFDEDGDDANGHCTFAYKVLDENGNVVASGTTYIDSLKVNDTFKDAMAYADGLAPGNYRIVIENDMW